MFELFIIILVAAIACFVVYDRALLIDSRISRRVSMGAFLSGLACVVVCLGQAWIIF